MGKRVSLKKVAPLMRVRHLDARCSRKYLPRTHSKHSLSVNANRVNRDFYAGQKRVSDIAYSTNCQRRVYLTVVLDFFDRTAIGWEISASTVLFILLP